MSHQPIQPSGSTPAESSSLTERVRARVAEVGLALERRSRATTPKSKRRRKSAAASPTLASTDNREAAREARSVRVVFHELGDAHRQYRLRTGQPVPTALRDAARAFKQAPSLNSLVPVAAFLDEAGLLRW